MQGTEILIREMIGDGILHLTLNDPTRRNALSEAMLGDMIDALAEIENDPNIRVVIVAANGSVFSSGHNLKELTAHRSDPDQGKAYFSKIMNMCSQMMQAIVNSPKPFIAEVQGIATAAGCQLVASCDLAIAANAASFSTPGVHIGLFCSTPMVALSRNVNNKHAMEMLLTGDMIPAPRAVEIGLINQLVAPETLQEATLAMAQKIASKSRQTVAIGKRAFYEQSEMTLAEAYDYASQVMVENMLANDAKEGIDAFIEKRKPVWET